LIEVWRGAPSGFPGSYPSRPLTTRQFLLPIAGTHHDNFTISDPLPELGDWIDFFFRRVPARFRRRAEAQRKLHVERRYSHT
jgi:hypothetical protein